MRHRLRGTGTLANFPSARTTRSNQCEKHYLQREVFSTVSWPWPH